MRPRDLTLLAFFLCAGAPAQGQALPGSPAAVADSFLARIARKDFLGATMLVDSASMEEFKASSVQSQRLNDSLLKTVRPRRTDVPLAVADWLEAEARKWRSQGSGLERDFGVSSVAELERVPAKEVFARWLTARHPEIEFERMRASSTDPRARDLPKVVMRARVPTVFGTVAASDSLAYAVFFDADRSSGPGPSILPVRLTPVGWRIPAAEAEMAIINGMCSIGFAILEADEVSNEERR